LEAPGLVPFGNQRRQDKTIDSFTVTVELLFKSVHSGHGEGGSRQVLASSGVQHGDRLGCNLLMLLTFVILLSLTFGTLMMELLLAHGPLYFLFCLSSHLVDLILGYNLNLSKCFWPSGDPIFPKFPSDIRRVTGLELLGSPLWGDETFFNEFLSSRLDKMATIQDKLVLLEDLHLLHSCLSSCKIIHLLRTVPHSVLKPYLC